MKHIGSINLASNLTLNAAGTGEIRNAYIERVTTIEEEAIALTLGLPHTGRLIFNTTIGGLKQWDGGAFAPVATSISGIIGQVNALQVAIGPIISTEFLFDPIVAGQLGNIGLTSPTSVFDVLKAIDVTIGELKAPPAFNTLAGVKVLQPADKQLLKYSTLESAWVNDGINLSDITGISATAVEVNYLAGTTSTVQTQFTALSDTIAAQASEIASLQAAITALTTPYTQAYTNQTIITVTHNRGQRYVRVIAVTATGEQVVPTDVVFTDANNLIITLPAAGTGTIIVS